MEELEGKLKEIVEEFKSDLASIRAGRASPSQVEDVKVEAYDSVMELKELAAITVPEPRQILVRPWDKSTLEDVERALAAANFNPNVEEDAVRIVLPPLTSEVREELIGEVNERAEDAKVKVRLARRDAVEKVEEEEEKKEISEDESFRRKKLIDNMVDEYNQKIEDISLEKEEQIKL